MIVEPGAEGVGNAAIEVSDASRCGNGASSRFSARGSAPSTPARFAASGSEIVSTNSATSSRAERGTGLRSLVSPVSFGAAGRLRSRGCAATVGAAGRSM